MFMSRAPFIDGFEFAACGGSRTGRWSIADFPRLRERLAASEGELVYGIDGVFDDQGRPALRVRMQGVLELVCQRCLEGTAFSVDVDAILALAASQEAIDREPVEVDGPDWIVAGKTMPVGELLEDELLLAVPLAARHARCREPKDVAQTGTDSPFAALKGLLRKGSRPGN